MEIQAWDLVKVTRPIALGINNLANFESITKNTNQLYNYLGEKY